MPATPQGFAALAVALLTVTSVPSAAATTPALPVELYFELKLLLRERRGPLRVEVDAWAGGRLALQARELPGGRAFELQSVIEHPWVFRWYPTRREAKLGVAIAVPSPAADPYASLAVLVEAQAHERWRRFWLDDRVDAAAPRSPPWAVRADGFWTARHVAARERRDALPEAPVYPFHVLGPLPGRLRFRTDARGAVVRGSIEEQVSSPWLANEGWSAARRGATVVGYGYWAPTARPQWEPRTYQALAAAVALLAWSPRGSPQAGAVEELIPRGGVEDVSAVVAALLPRAAGRLGGRGAAPARMQRQVDDARHTVIVGGSEPFSPRGAAELRARFWRYSRIENAGDGTVEDEVQWLVEHHDPQKLRIWLRIGYRPLSRATDPSGG